MSSLKQLIDSIEHLHTLHIPHGDLHPGNVIVGKEDGGYVLSLIDTLITALSRLKRSIINYSPENIDTCTAFERDNYAVMKMACELLGVPWGGSSDNFQEIFDRRRAGDQRPPLWI